MHGNSGQRAQDQVADRQPDGGTPATGTPAGPGATVPAATATPAPPAGTATPGKVSEPVTELPQPVVPEPEPSPTPESNMLQDLLGGLLGG
ncbi:hypothetical protein [Catenuloplanes japonicus]|uniref:hypothetical protein n=1 Tax=Catenuloplanes japonicus TaxID=33876 RepID=UPI0005241614|nr:hypothetical protein [Catenuloplanes japonicus]